MDNLDILISQRLVERHRKLDIIQDIIKKEKPAQKHKLPLKATVRILVTLAACFCIGWLVLPLLHNNQSDQFTTLQITAPSFEDFRGIEANQFETLISQKEYQKALGIVNSQIALSRQEIVELEPMTQGEEKDYLISVEKENLSELLWSKIYILMQSSTDNETEQIKALVEEYIQIQPNQKHLADAEKILKNL